MNSTPNSPHGARTSYAIWSRAVLGITGALVVLYAARPVFNVDLFWHLELGEWIAQHWAIPKTDMFSAVHPDSSWVQFQWLWELLAYLLVSVGGITSLRFFQVIVLTITFVLLFKTVNNYTNHKPLSTFLVVFGLLLYEERFQARPDALNLLFLTIIFYLAIGTASARRVRAALGVFVICALWSNLHAGSAILASAVLGALAFGRTMQTWMTHSDNFTDIRSDWALFVASVAGLVSNPVFFSGWSHFLEIYPFMRATGNWEWEPTYRMTVNGLNPYFVFLSFAPSFVAIVYAMDFGIRLHRKEHRLLDWGEVALSVGLLFLAHQASRNAVLALFPLLFCSVRILRRFPGRRAAFCLLFCATMLLGVSYAYRIEHIRGGLLPAIDMLSYDLEPTAYPEELGDFLSEAEIEGNILNQGKWGGYLIWSAWPRCRVFVDTRHHLTAAMWDTYYAFHNPLTRSEASKAAANTWDVDLIAYTGPTFPLQQAPIGWELLFKAGPQELYLRSDSPHAHGNRLRALKWAGVSKSESTTVVAQEVVPKAAQRWLSHRFNKTRLTEAHAMLGKDVGGKSERIIGGILAQAGAFNEAKPFLLESSRQSPERTRTWYWLAIAAWHTQDHLALADALAKLASLPLNDLSPVEKMELSWLSQRIGPTRGPRS